ncbi:nucleoside hydrolase [Streptomyces violaceus]|uniref:Nucleoside hydrolase n=1 Tax=Streptomyces violaceus TaxID=1936 RepID=A0ABY9UD73_STRVL|nr:nucleoside hydrolase [Streptomyces janthinus]WND18186.1 nucleoside hydrolase [Streptomyces janthinus]
MGEYRDDSAEELRRHWQTMSALSSALPSSGLGVLAERLNVDGPWPDDLTESPMILDTDIGSDPDDALAVAAAARQLPQLALVLTTEQTDWPQARARYARWLMNSLGRTEVPVVAGVNLPSTENYYIYGLIPDLIPPQPRDVIGAVREVCRIHDGPVRWVGLGPLSNVRLVLEHAPDLVGRLRITQLGGALRHPDARDAEPNIRRDVSAARAVLKAVHCKKLSQPQFIGAETASNLSVDVTQEHGLYAMLSAPNVPVWAQILVDHLDQWFKVGPSGNMQHAALTLSAAMGLPFVEYKRMLVAVDKAGRTNVSRAGTAVRWSVRADYEAFMSWLSCVLNPQIPNSSLMLSLCES